MNLQLDLVLFMSNRVISHSLWPGCVLGVKEGIEETGWTGNAGKSDKQAILRSTWLEEFQVLSEHQGDCHILSSGSYAFFRYQFMHKDKPLLSVTHLGEA